MTGSVSHTIDQDLHTHTIYSHGKGTIEDNVREGLKENLKTIGITDHGPGHISYGVKRENLSKMREEVDRLNIKYPDIEILLGLEANIVNQDGSLDLLESDYENLDYIIAGYHYGVLGKNPIRSSFYIVRNWLATKIKIRPKGLTAYNTNVIIKAIENNDLKFITHLGDKGPVDVLEISKACKRRGTLVEINAHHKAPSEEEIRLIADTGVDFILSSDAHSPENVGQIDKSLYMAIKAGIDKSRIINL